MKEGESMADVLVPVALLALLLSSVAFLVVRRKR